MVSFGQLLRQLRTSAGLSQEELALAATLSTRAVSDLERGINLTARKETARLLADALHLSGQDRIAFEAAARGRVPADGIAAATRTLPRDTSSFTDRVDELRQLAATDGSGGLYTIGGMAGVGKTAFAVHAAHQLAARFPDGQIFLPLHAHTAGQRPVQPADALASLLQTIGIAPAQIPPSLEARMSLWRDRLTGRQLLLVLDDAADSDQVRPLLPGAPGILVLITSRRHLTALDDARVISLDTLPPGDAAQLLARLATRPGLHPADPALAEIARLCGWLPLALGMLARQLYHHPAWSPAELAADLAAARDRLALMHAENLSVAAAFDRSYQDLTGHEQKMFRCLGLHPGSDVDAYAAAALADVSLAEARRDLESLYDHYLLTETGRGRYRFHDLIREHARSLAAADPPAERDAATGRLLDYYLHAARAADQYLSSRAAPVTPAPAGAAPAHAATIAGRDDAVSWMAAERLNLHAAAGYAAASGRAGHAAAIPAAMHEFLRCQGHWDQAITLHQAALQAAHDAGNQLAEARALTDLGDMQFLTDDYPAATASLTQALDLYRGLGDRLGEASALTSLGAVQQAAGDSPAATASLTRALRLYGDLGNQLGQASALTELGTVHYATGDQHAAAVSHERALDLYRRLGDRLGEANALTGLGTVQYLTGQYRASEASHTRALKLYRDLDDRSGEAEALNNIADMVRASAAPAAARPYYEQALALATRIAAQREQARALEGVGLCHIQESNPEEGRKLLRQALAVYQRIGSPHAHDVKEMLVSRVT